MKMVLAPTDSHGIPGISNDTVSSFDHLLGNQDKWDDFLPFLLCHHSSDIKQSGMSIHDPIASKVMHMAVFLCLCLMSVSVINSCGPGLYSILMLY